MVTVQRWHERALLDFALVPRNDAGVVPLVFVLVISGVSQILHVILAGEGRVVHVQAGLQLLPILVGALLVRRTLVLFHGNAAIVGLLCVQGGLVGILSCIEGLGDWDVWFEYTALAASWWLAFAVGRSLAWWKNDTSLMRIALALTACDLLFLIPRVITVGLDVRTSWGMSVWLCLMFSGALLNWGQTLNQRIVFSLGTVVGVFACALSGMRTAIILLVLSLFGALTFLIRRRAPLVRFSLKGTLFTAGMLLISASIAAGAVENGIEKLLYVLDRLSVTLFHEDRPMLDEGGAGRELEAQLAVETFVRNASPLQYFVGYGHGFIFDALFSPRGAHVHITPIAFFVRYGIVGTMVYLFFLLKLMRTFYICLRASCYSEQTVVVRGSVCQAALNLWIGALTSGLLLLPTGWLITGLAAGCGDLAHERPVAAPSPEKFNASR